MVSNTNRGEEQKRKEGMVVLNMVLFALPELAELGNAAKGLTRSLDNLSSLKGATWEEVESLIPKDWIRGPMTKGEGIKFVNTAKKGEQILLEKGWSGAKDPLHAGPYMKVSRNGQVTRIPLSGNPTLK